MGRALPSIEYAAPFLSHEVDDMQKVLPYSVWKCLSPHGRRVARHICAEAGDAAEEPYFRMRMPGKHKVLTALLPHFARCRHAFPTRRRTHYASDWRREGKLAHRHRNYKLGRWQQPCTRIRNVWSHFRKAKARK